MSGLDSLPKAKWGNSGKQPIVKQDWIDVETAILQSVGRSGGAPYVTWVDNTAVRVQANSDLKAACVMSGFPNIFHPGAMIDAGLTDGKQRINTSNVDMDFDTAATFWGSEKASQWYALFAIAANADTTFTLKAMPWMRVASQSTQTITLRNNLNTANIGYGFTTDSLANYKLLMISGASKGLIRTVTNNNNDNSTGGTITYSGTALTVSAGDWFIILPYGTNFRWIHDFWNNAYSNIVGFYRFGNEIHYQNTNPDPQVAGYFIPGTPSGENYGNDVLNGASSLANFMLLSLLHYSNYENSALSYGYPHYCDTRNTHLLQYFYSRSDMGNWVYSSAIKIPLYEHKVYIYTDNAQPIYSIGWAYPFGYQ